MKKIFIAHSTGMLTNALEYAEFLEKEIDVKCYVPIRDTEQVMTTEEEIVRTNLNAIKDSEEVHVLWDLSSLGTIFDLGCAYALGKPIYIIKTKKHHWTRFIVKNEGGRIL